MTISTAAATAGVMLFPLALVYAGVMDVATMKIRNALVLALAAGWLLLAPLAGFGAAELWWSFALAATVFAITFVFFALGWIGGGDAKLAAATAIWLGFDHLGAYALSASALGGLLTVSIIVLRKWPLPGVLLARQWAARLHEPGTGIPYGIALASAGLILYPETAIWLGTATAIH